MTNAQAVDLVERVQRADRLRQGLTELPASTSASRENAHLRHVLTRLARLLIDTGFTDDE